MFLFKVFNGKSIKHLVNYGTIVIAGGGGGIPAYNDENGILHGLDGVIDKDYSAALLGRIIRADELFMITDVDNVFLIILRVIHYSSLLGIWSKFWWR